MTVVLASGGMDSTVLLWDLAAQGFQPIPLFVDYGQHCRAHERETLGKVIPPSCQERLQVVSVADVYRHTNSAMIVEKDLWKDEISADDLYLPYRTLLLLAVGATFAQQLGSITLYSGFINSNHAKEVDCSAEFFIRLHSVFGAYDGVRLELPYRNLSKYEVAKRGIELGAPIALTFSCQASSRVPCGACPNCVDRLTALQQLRRDHE